MTEQHTIKMSIKADEVDDTLLDNLFDSDASNKTEDNLFRTKIMYGDNPEII